MKTYYSNEPEGDLIDILSSIRRYKGLTQENMATMLNGSKSNVSRFESNVHSPTLKTLFEYVWRMGCKLKITVVENDDGE